MTNHAPPPPSDYQPVTNLNPSDEKLWATLIHLGGILFWILPALIGFLVLKDRGPFVREHTRQALNFQIAYTLYAFAIVIVAGIFTVVTLGIAGFLLVLAPMAIAVAMLVFMIMAAIKANSGAYYKYPLTIEFIK